MTYTRIIGDACNKVISLIVRGLALARIHPNVLTFVGLLINVGAAVLLAFGQFRWAGVVIIGAGIFDMVDGRVARHTNQVTRFGGFFDSVLDRYSDLGLLMGLLVYYASINRNLPRLSGSLKRSSRISRFVEPTANRGRSYPNELPLHHRPRPTRAQIPHRI